MMAYFAFFQSHLAYGVMLWGNCLDSHKVFLCQKRVIRLIAGIGRQDSCRPFFTKFNVLTLPSLFIFYNLIFVKKHICNFDDRKTVHNYPTRNCNQLEVPATRLTKVVNSHKALQVRLYNRLPAAVKNLKYNCFRSRIQELLVKKPVYSLEEYFENAPNFL